ncbi:hypothetical protein H4J55_00365 [Colwellia sp. MB3u-22]|nr:hypothetical protein [Colwellia sp. MB02u-7]MBA6235646.1 hypothetical protein [Colwellia sp. MB02u-11]MBA6297910.1 hypothetical protein [Colwellia sp. MB3u-22]MBA6309242.1 hypothetical protein [Colwellia sp. MB3u-64]
MRIIAVFILLFTSFQSIAGLPPEISFEQASLLGINVSLKGDLGENGACSSLNIYTPFSHPEHPEYKGVRGVVYIYKGATLISATALKVDLSNETTQAKMSGCLPLSKEYNVVLLITYVPKEGVLVCPPGYGIDNLGGYFKSAYNKPFKQDF